MTKALVVAAIVVVLIALVWFVGLPIYIGMNTPLASDASESNEVATAVDSMLKKPAFALGTPTRSGAIVHVYGLLDTEARQELVNNLRKLKDERGWRAIDVEFYGSGTWVDNRFVEEGYLGSVEIP